MILNIRAIEEKKKLIQEHVDYKEKFQAEKEQFEMMQQVHNNYVDHAEKESEQLHLQINNLENSISNTKAELSHKTSILS